MSRAADGLGSGNHNTLFDESLLMTIPLNLLMRSAGSILLASTVLTAVALGQWTRTTTFDVTATLIQNVTYPGSTTPYPMTATFAFTYTPGDFENGTSELLTANFPWFGSQVGGVGGAEITVDPDQLEFTMIGNIHSLGLDVTLGLLTDLDPGAPSSVDTANSHFTIESGIAHQGSMTGGTVQPRHGLDISFSAPCPATAPGSLTVVGCSPGQLVVILAALGRSQFSIPPGVLCAGTHIGLDPATAIVGPAVVADAAGLSTISTAIPAPLCGLVSVQAVDIGSCLTSEVLNF